MNRLKFNGNVMALNYTRTILSFLLLFLIIVTSLRYKTWNVLGRKIDIFHRRPSQSKDILPWISVFLFGHLASIFLNYMVYYTASSELNMSTWIIFVATDIILWYQFLETMIIWLILEKIRGTLRRSLKQLELNFMNVRQARRYYFHSIVATRYFNKIFGYQIAINYAHWLILFEAVCFNIAERSNPGKFQTDFLMGWKVIFLICLFLVFNLLNLFSVVISCDNTTSESLKLMDRCYELQEKFDRSTFEYQELQALAFYAAHNQLRFTAADLFEIRRSSMLALIATSTTYFIALVQFY
ncbi:uncharacterized protein LOC143194345 isoform X3 [Rhynchophorus ferrugineus]|uniref:uncharacterized protein LOC143194345 isoform X2 n=1 Tax=Rhynchophorus ferrugineus TaxID=354439 RepID=UPI003FCE692D